MLATGALGAGSTMSGTAGSLGANLFGGTMPWLTNLFSGMGGVLNMPLAGATSGGRTSASAKTGAANTNSGESEATAPNSQGDKEKTTEEKWADFFNGLNAITRSKSMANPDAAVIQVLPTYQPSAFLGRM